MSYAGALALSTDARFTIIVTLFLATMGGIGALLTYVVRGAVKWTKVEDKLENLVGDVRELVSEKDNTHKSMIAQMRDDRTASDRRLRWLEENLWKNRGTR